MTRYQLGPRIRRYGHLLRHLFAERCRAVTETDGRVVLGVFVPVRTHHVGCNCGRDFYGVPSVVRQYWRPGAREY